MEKLYLGVSKKDITPKVGSRLAGYRSDIYSSSVHDNLDVTAFSFMQGDRCAIMISATIVTLETDHADEIRARISKECNVPKENILIACTHTHSGPTTFGVLAFGERDEEYCENILVPRMIEAAKEATESRVPVTMGYETGKTYIGINRRELTIDNYVELGQNPWAPYDPRMTVISFKNSDGACVANMIHFGMHGTAAGSNREISQDFAGVMVRRMEILTGGVTAFFNGAQGDVGPRLTNGTTAANWDEGDIKYAEEIGGIAAHDAMKIWKSIKRFTTPHLNAYTSTMTLPVKPRPSLDEAKLQYAECLAAPPETDSTRKVIAASRMAYYKNVIDSYEENYTEKEYDKQNETFVSLGKLKFAGTPFEPFCEISMRIQKERPEDEILLVACTNGRAGYLPTESELNRGGYEVISFRFSQIQPYADDTDWHFMKETLKNLE